MTRKEVLSRLTGTGLPKGELKEAMFKVYNDLVGKSRYMPKWENPRTGCGSCIQRVKTSIWKWYHSDEKAPTYNNLEFTGKYGIRNQPIYKLIDPKQKSDDSTTEQEG
jgi:hypothetical protein